MRLYSCPLSVWTVFPGMLPDGSVDDCVHVDVYSAAVVIAFVYLYVSNLSELRAGSTHALLLLYGPAVAAQCYWVQQLARRGRAAVQTMLLIQLVSVVAVVASRFMQGAVLAAPRRLLAFLPPQLIKLADLSMVCQTPRTTASTRTRSHTCCGCYRRLRLAEGSSW